MGRTKDIRRWTYETVTEKQLQDTAIEMARLCGYTLIFHDTDSRKNARGFLDLHMMRLPSDLWEADHIIRELKKEKGRVSPEQKLWLAGYVANGIDAAILKPSGLDEFIKRLQKGKRT